MAITLDDKSVDIFKLYDEMSAAYTNDIEGYRTVIKAIEVLIMQKEEALQAIKDKTVALIQNKISSQPVVDVPGAVIIAEEAPVPVEKKKSKAVVVEQTQAIPAPVVKTKPAREKKTIGKSKSKKAGKVKTSDLKCLYHPDTPISDIGRQLCTACKWKLINSGLLNHYKDPAVISFLKGEITEIPNLGQSMCPIHPAVPSYNKKTGLCQRCQSKAKEIGVTDRPLTEKELEGLRNQ